MEAIGEVLAALAAGDGAKAARIAETRLGLRSPGAETCNPAQAANTTAMVVMMAAEFMPEIMRESGFAMHEVASHLAGETAKLQQSSELKPAVGLLHKSREDARPAKPLID